MRPGYYVLRFPTLTDAGGNPREYAEQIMRDDRLQTPQTLVDAVARRFRLQAGTRAGETIPVQVLERLTVQGVERLELRGSIAAVLPLPPRTEEEFRTDMDELLKALPGPFIRFVEQYAYEHGHAAGYDEIYCVAQGLAASLQSALAECVVKLRPAQEPAEFCGQCGEPWPARTTELFPTPAPPRTMVEEICGL